MQLEITIPLFPLGVVLLPEMPLPLHIFEERYKIMIGECLDQNREFGVVYYDGNQLQRVGCTARIIEVLKRYDDGRMDIMTRGVKRFEIMNVSDTKAYLQSRIIYLADDIEEEIEEFANLATEGIDLLQQLEGLTGKKGEYSFPEKPDLKLLSFMIPSNEGFTLEEKQRFLEMTSRANRLRKSVESLRRIVERTKITEDIQKIIGGNGNVPKDLIEIKKELA
jgi:ATP-dependent Lon protease